MKKLVILSLLALVIAGLISSCSKNDPIPDSPIVGQWDLNRYTVTDAQPTSFSAINRTYTYDVAQAGTNSYAFKNDGTFVWTYPTSSTTNGTINGTWMLAGTILTMTFNFSSGSDAEVYTYNSSANELTSNKYVASSRLTNTTTQVQETVYYNRSDVYKKKQ